MHRRQEEHSIGTEPGVNAKRVWGESVSTQNNGGAYQCPDDEPGQKIDQLQVKRFPSPDRIWRIGAGA
jgi:hypothetical protein